MVFRVQVEGGEITAAAGDEVVNSGAWLYPTPTPRPEDTDEGTWAEGVTLVDGVPVQTWTPRPWTAAEVASAEPERLAQLQAARRARALREAARTALTGNGAYLALSPPTAGQVAAQVAALTRQNSAIIKLVLGQFDED